MAFSIDTHKLIAVPDASSFAESVRVEPSDAILKSLIEAGVIYGDVSATAPSDTSLWWLDSSTTPAILKRYSEGEWSPAYYDGGGRYDLAVFSADRPQDGEILLKHVFTSDINFPADMAGSYAKADDASTATAVFSITKNGTQFATITFTTSAIGVFSGSATTFAAGDVLRIIAPVAADTTLADISITLYGTR